MDDRKTKENNSVRACEQTALLDAYVDGELSEDQAASLREHLDGCPACRAYLDDILAIREAFPTVEDTQVPEGFAERVLDRLPARITVLGNWRRRELWRRAALPVAASLALILALRGVWLTGGAGGTDEIMSRNLPVAEETVQASDPAVTGESGTDSEAAVTDEDSAVTESGAAVTESETSVTETEGTDSGAESVSMDSAAEPVSMDSGAENGAMDGGTPENGAAGAAETAAETGAANAAPGPSPSTETAPASQSNSQNSGQANHQADSRGTQTSKPSGGAGGRTGNTGNTNNGNTNNGNTNNGNTNNGNTNNGSTAASSNAASGKTGAETPKAETSPVTATPVTPAAPAASDTPQVPQPENPQDGWIPREWETGGLSPVSGYEDTEGTASLMEVDDPAEEPGSSEELADPDEGEAGQEDERGEDTADHSLSLPPEAAEYLETYRPAAQTEKGAWYDLTEEELRALGDTLENAGLYVEAARAGEAADNAGSGDTVRVFLRDDG